MTLFRNDAKGTRGVLLKDGSNIWIAPGETKSVPGHRVRGLPAGLVEVDPAEAPQVGEELPQAPTDIAAAFDRDGDGNPGGSLPHDPPALSAMTRPELEAQAVIEEVDLESIEGTGANGNVLVDDIRKAIEAKRAAK